VLCHFVRHVEIVRRLFSIFRSPVTQMSITTKQTHTTLASLVQTQSVRERCSPTKRILVLLIRRVHTVYTCGSTAILGGGPGPLFRLVGLRVLIDFPAPALIPLVPHLLVLRGMHAHTLEVQPVRHRLRPLTRTAPTLTRHTLIRHTLIRHQLGTLILHTRIILLPHYRGVDLKSITFVT